MKPDQSDRVFNTKSEGSDDFLDLTHEAFSPRDSVRYYTVSPGLMSKYQNEFRITFQETDFINNLSMHTVPFDSAVCGYFNRDLARAMALADWGMSRLDDWYEVQYLLEDAVIRLCSCWEYLFQHLSYFIDLDEGPLASNWGRAELLGTRAYDYEWVKEADNSESLLAVPKPLHEALKGVNAVKNFYSFQYLSTQDGSKKFFRHMRDNYAEHEWINRIKKLFREPETKALRELRNDIVHVYSLTNTIALRESNHLGIPTTGFNFSHKDPRDIWKLLVPAHKTLSKAIPLLRKALITEDLPEPKELEGVLFHAHELVCNSCHAVTHLPCPIDLRGMVFCRNCATWTPEEEAEIKDAIPLNHIVFTSLVHEHVERMSEHIERAPSDG